MKPEIKSIAITVLNIDGWKATGVVMKNTIVVNLTPEQVAYINSQTNNGMQPTDASIILEQ